MTYHEAREAAHASHKGRQRRFGGHAEDDAKQDAREVARGVHEHERHMHKGEKETKLKLRHGGEVEGRRAKGGRLDRKGKKGTTVNIVLDGGQQQPRPVPVPVRQPVPVPVPAGGGAPPGAMPPRPPVAGMGMPPGGMPSGGAPMMPRKRGGSVKMTAGSLSGEGRMEKTRMVE